MSRRSRGANSNSPRRAGGQQQRGRNARTTSVRAASARRQEQQAPAAAVVRQQQNDAEAEPAQNEEVPDRFDQAAQQLPEDLRQFARCLRTTVVEENGRVSWTDIQGLRQAKNSLIFAAHLPLVRPGFFVGALRRTKGILLFGPPGTGKTLDARVAQHRPEMTFFNVTSATLTAPLLGESEKNVKALFNLAKALSPSTKLMPSAPIGAVTQSTKLRDVLSITTDNNSVIFVAATKFPWDIDHALLRRLDRRIYVALPDVMAREQILRHNMRGNFVENINWPDIAQRLNNYSGADIAAVCVAVAIPKQKKGCGRA